MRVKFTDDFMEGVINVLKQPQNSREGCLEWLQIVRGDRHMDRLEDTDFDGWTKEDIIAEISRVWFGH